MALLAEVASTRELLSFASERPIGFTILIPFVDFVAAAKIIAVYRFATTPGLVPATVLGRWGDAYAISSPRTFD